MPHLKNVILALPPRVEQDHIARFLDWKVSEVNRFIRSKRKEITLLTEFANAQIKNAVFGGIQKDAPTRDSGIKLVGNIPSHWDVKVLFEAAMEQNISNKTIRNQTLLSLSYGKIVNKDINTTDGLLPASFDSYQIANNKNIILRLTDLQNDKRSLRVGLATQTGIITSAYTCLQTREGVFADYLYLLLHSYDICKVFYGMGGGVRQSIGYNDIKRMLLPMPPTITEQQEIVTYCYSLRERIEKIIAEIKQELVLLTEYRTKLVSDAVTGRIDVREVNIQPFEANIDNSSADEDTEFEEEYINGDELEVMENASV